MSCNTGLIFYVDNPNVLEWQDVTNSITGLAVTNADVVVTLLDTDDAQVAGQTWPATMTHVAGGTYRAILEADIAIIANRRYFAHIVAEVSGDPMADILAPITVRTRAE